MRVRDTFAAMQAWRCGVLSLVGSLLLTTTAGAQARPPSLSKAEREALRTAVLATRTLAAVPEAVPTDVSADLFRASDGSHYVALSLPAPAELPPTAPVVLYVKLVPRAVPDASGVVPTVSTEPRSAVLEWLEGERSDPLPMRARRVVTVPTGEFPVGGPSSMSGRDGGIGQSTAALRLMDRQLEQQRERAEVLERERRAALEGKAAPAATLLPFEDFDLQARLVSRPGQGRKLERAITAAPGEYDVVLGWSSAGTGGRVGVVGAVRHHLSLPAAPRDTLRLGSVVLADGISVISEPYRSEQQSAHPYVLGTTDITPAADRRFTNDERLAVAFQIINPAGDTAGKPDVRVGFRLYRRTGAGETLVGTPSPLTYAADTLPVDFNVGLGHPLLAALALPLSTLPRGDYRLAIAVTDLLARTSATGEATFQIVPTRAALLAAIPGLQPPLRRGRAVSDEALAASLEPLHPLGTTPILRQILSAIAQRRFAEAIRDTPMDASERPLAELLRTVAYYGLGDTPASLAARLHQAESLGAPTGAVRYWQGWIDALQARDADAAAAWHDASRHGWPPALAAPLESDALLRLGRISEAATVAARALDAGVRRESLAQAVALAALEDHREDQALAIVSPFLASSPDAETLWLAIRAVAVPVLKTDSSLPPDRLTTLSALVERYRALQGRHMDRADEWVAFLTASSSAP
ncbi:MAG: hypothetical protein FJW29_03305 [Acidobacteria bacterium]|nr:hypothetical protein [Acidobacteriota bacterium]